MRWMQRFFYIGMLLLSFVIAGATSILTQDVGFEAVTEPWFYLNQIITDIAIVFIVYGVLYMCIDRYMESNDEFKKAETNINDFAVSDDFVPTIFGRYLENLNDIRKRKQYEFDCKQRLTKLDNARRFPFFWKRKYGEADFYLWWHGTEEEKNSNEYCVKRRDLEERLTEEFIERNLKFLIVKYDKVTVDVVLSGFYSRRRNRSPNEFVDKHPNAKVAIHKLPSFLFGFGFTFLASSLIFGAVRFDWSALVSFSSKLIALLWNTVVTVRYAQKFFRGTILKDVIFRSGVIIEYRKWLKEKAAETARKDKLEVQARSLAGSGNGGNGYGTGTSIPVIG